MRVFILSAVLGAALLFAPSAGFAERYGEDEDGDDTPTVEIQNAEEIVMKNSRRAAHLAARRAHEAALEAAREAAAEAAREAAAQGAAAGP